MTFSYLSSYGITDVGRVRTNNEDAILLLPEDGVFCVADGMGGAEAGEVASEFVVDRMRKGCEGSISTTFDLRAKLLHDSIVAANEAIREWSFKNRVTTCGSTVVALAFDHADRDRAVVVHAGDSRLYRWDGRRLTQLTRDHSLEERLPEAGRGLISPMLKNVITQAVGVRETMELEETPVALAEGDVLLLCSDGLTNMLDDEKISRLLRQKQGKPLQDLAETLVASANAAGGKDNVSVILIRRAGEDEGPGAASTVVDAARRREPEATSRPPRFGRLGMTIAGTTLTIAIVLLLAWMLDS